MPTLHSTSFLSRPPWTLDGRVCLLVASGLCHIDPRALFCNLCICVSPTRCTTLLQQHVDGLCELATTTCRQPRQRQRQGPARGADWGWGPQGRVSCLLRSTCLGGRVDKRFRFELLCGHRSRYHRQRQRALPPFPPEATHHDCALTWSCFPPLPS